MKPSQLQGPRVAEGNTTNVTAKMATPLSEDSKLSDAHLELLGGREQAKGMPLRPKD